MKIKRKYRPRDTRIINKFLFLPRTINGETRWLERVKIYQQFDFYYDFIIPLSEWTDIKWMD